MNTYHLRLVVVRNKSFLIDILGLENLRLWQASSSDSITEPDLEGLAVSGSRLLAQEVLLKLLSLLTSDK